MEKTPEATKSSLLYRKIDELNLTPRARAEAYAALQSAERLTTAITWVVGKFTAVGAGRPAALAVKLKHQ